MVEPLNTVDQIDVKAQVDKIAHELLSMLAPDGTVTSKQHRQFQTMVDDIQGPNWGTSVIPKEYWIDPNRRYRTVDGRDVVDIEVKIEVKIENGAGLVFREVTYPVHGHIVTKRGSKDVREWHVWALDGRRFLKIGPNKMRPGLDLVPMD